MSSESNARSFIVLCTDIPWVHALAEALAAHGPTAAIRLYDFRSYRTAPKLPDDVHSSPNFRRLTWAFPPGYIGKLAWLFRPFLSARIRRLARSLQRESGAAPFVVVPYPFYGPALRGIPAERLIYYNLDDYTLYERFHPENIARTEADIIRRAGLTVCLAISQVEMLRRQFPERATSIQHFPLGVAQEFINPNPSNVSSRPFRLGFIGNLSDRVDWRLVGEIAALCPSVQFEFVGPLEWMGAAGGQDERWREQRSRALAIPNVRHLPAVPQEEVIRHYWDFSATWIPYDPLHAFNVASCPTKIMDGLATGRPMLSTPLPECRLYPEWIDLFSTAAEGAAQILRLEAKHLAGELTERAERQLAFARENTWPRRAKQLLDLLPSDLPSSASTSSR
ncbi:MAG TPA: hypothetical protein VF593_13315 [Chthoniobacteraceae bacterium]|jgi:glycosyltransferase involved in cell wall biosynthesis